jgi:hypothetical protein
MNVIQRLGELMEAHRIAHAACANTCSAAVRAQGESHLPGGMRTMAVADRAHEIALDTEEDCRETLWQAMHEALPQLLAVVKAAEEVQYQAAKAGPFDGEQSLEDAFVALDAALAPLITAHDEEGGK